MSLNYDEYLKEHVANCQHGLDWMWQHISDIDEAAMQEAQENIRIHDLSKYTNEEYKAYDDYFYGGNKTNKVKEAFDKAWLHHIHNNPHHWQYWVLINDDADEGTRGLEMPLSYIYEMIADWWSFSWRTNRLDEIFSWYDEHKDRMILHKNTRKHVDDILEQMRSIISMQKKREGSFEEDDIMSHSDDKKAKKYGVPEEEKFPMPDARHVRSAIKFFNYVEPENEEELAKAILRRAKEYGVDLSEMSIGDENRFKNYISKKDEHLEHHGIKGQVLQRGD